MWPFSRRPSRSSSARSSRPSFKPSLEALETRNLMSATIEVPVAINQQVLSYAEAHVGQIVGDGNPADYGQCATLAAMAVKSGGGVPYTQLGPTGLNANYVWGKLVATLTPSNGNTSAIQPGDILQLNNVTEVDTMTIHYANGQTKTETSYQYPFHHTAIVTTVGGNAGNDIQVLQANVKLSPNESLTSQQQVQGGDYWGGSSSRTTNYPQYGYSITVTHTMTSGEIEVYQPYENVPLTLPSLPKL